MGKIYPVGIVGESNYQPAIRRCRVGERVDLVLEPDNPHDPLAIAVVSSKGETIGYIGRDNFVQSAVHDQGKRPIASIRSITASARGQLGVVIDVDLEGETELATRPFTASPSRAEGEERSATSGMKIYGLVAVIVVASIASCVGPSL